MSTNKSLVTVALAGLLAAPLSAQIVVRSDPTATRTPRAGSPNRSTIDQRIEAARRRIEADSNARRTDRAANRIPPGHLPPKGMCRVWIDGVPAGHQPPVTDCATAERNRTVNSRVIYGDRDSFPGKGKGKLKKAEKRAEREAREGRRCTVRDGVVVGGRVINVCRDSTLQGDRRGRSGRNEVDDDDDDDSDERSGRKGGSSKRKAGRN